MITELQHRSFWKKKKSQAGVKVFLFFLVVVCSIIFYQLFSEKHYYFEPWTEVVLKKGDSLEVFYQNFSFFEKFSFKWYLKKNPEAFSTILEGTYLLSGEYSAQSLLEHLKKGPESEIIKVRILEWWSIYDIDEYLASKGYLQAGEYVAYATNPEKISALSERYEFFDSSVKSLEGFLYPDTYHVDVKDDFLKTLVSIQLNTFKNKVWTPLQSDFSSFQQKTHLSVYEAVILASIVEKEEKNPDNKPTVAGIFLNRIRKGMLIWADITLCYQFKKPYSTCTPAVISKNVYDTKNPYNTRQVAWLTPTPIANPSENTIRAVLQMKSTNYLFYLHDSQGNIHYAETNEGHVKNKNLYL